MHSRPTSVAIRFGLSFMLVLSLAHYAAPSAVAEGLVGTVIDGATGAVDLIYDDVRGLLYITNGGSVQRYDPFSRTMLSPIEIGGSLVSLDLSPDHRTLAVTDSTVSDGRSRIHLVDLQTETVQQVDFPLGYYLEGGTWAVAYGQDGRLLLTSQFYGSGWVPLRRYDPETGSTEEIAGVRNFTHLAASGDRSVIGFAEADISDGSWGRYRVADGSIIRREGYEAGTSNFNYTITTDRFGTRHAIGAGWSGYGASVHVFETPSFNRRTYSSAWGAKYSPSQDVLYLPQNGSDTIVAIDSIGLEELARYNSGATWRTSWPLAFPRLAVPRDHSLLFTTVSAGVSAIPMTTAVRGVVEAGELALPVSGATVELWRSTPGGWSMESTRVTGSAGSWHYTTADPAPMKARVIDTATGVTAWVGGTDITSASSLTPTLAPSACSITRLPVVGGAAVRGTLTSSWKGRPIGGGVVKLYSATSSQAAAVSTCTAEGAYSFVGLPHGRYRLEFSDPANAHRSAYLGGSSRATGSQLVTISDASETYVADQQLEFIPLRLQGQVVSSFRGSALSSVSVEFHRQGEVSVDTTQTDINGRWTYQTDDARPVRIRVSDPSGMHAARWYESAEDASAATELVPARIGTPPSAHLELPLVNGGAIRGVVRSSRRGEVITGIRVRAFLDSDSLPEVGAALTDAQGEFVIAGLGRGGYKLAFEDPMGVHYGGHFDGRSSLADATAVSVDSSRSVSIMTTLAVIPTRATGVVRSSFHGIPVPNAYAEVWRRSGGSWQLESTMTADGTGVWSYSSDTTEPVRVHFSDPSGMHSAVWHGGASLLDAIDILPTRGTAVSSNTTMTLANSAWIDGTVTGSKWQAPLQGIAVTLLRDGTVETTTSTGADGRYRFGELGPSDYEVRFEDPTGLHNVSLTPAITVAAPGGVAADHVMPFANPWFRGTVQSQRFGVRIPWPTIEVWRQSEEIWELSATVAGDHQGMWTYSTESTAPARFRVRDQYGLHAPVWIGGTDLASAREFNPAWTVGESADTSMVCSNGGSIAGTARDDMTGKALPGIRVTLYTYGGAVETTVTGMDGRYTFDTLPVATYRLHFEDTADRYFPQFYHYGEELQDATPVHIVRPERVEVSPWLEPSQYSWILTFEEPRVARDSTATPYVGEPVTIEALLFDAESGIPVDEEGVQIQSSTDGVTWATEAHVDVINTYLGRYEANVVPSKQGLTYYRFHVPPDEWFTTTFASAGIPVNAHGGTTTWTQPYFGSASTGPTSTTTGYRQLVSVRAKLKKYSGAPLDGATVRIEESTDGVRFTPVYGATVENLFGGTYQAKVASDRKKFYRFTSGALGYDAASSSDRVTVIPEWWASSMRAVTLTSTYMTVQGTAKPWLDARPIVYLQQYRNGRWVQVRRQSAAMTPKGTAATAHTLYGTKFLVRSGVFRFYSVIPGGANHTQVQTPYVKIRR